MIVEYLFGYDHIFSCTYSFFYDNTNVYFLLSGGSHSFLSDTTRMVFCWFIVYNKKMANVDTSLLP